MVAAVTAASGARPTTRVQRLQTATQFRSLLDAPRVSTSEHFTLHRRAELPGAPAPAAGTVAWIGAMVPKRWARRAVTRNLIRRQIYSLMQERSPHLLPAAYLVRQRAAFARDEFISAQSERLRKAVRSELTGLFARVERAAPANPASDSP